MAIVRVSPCAGWPLSPFSPTPEMSWMGSWSHALRAWHGILWDAHHFRGWTHKSSKNHPKIIQKSSINHPNIIHKSSINANHFGRKGGVLTQQIWRIQAATSVIHGNPLIPALGMNLGENLPAIQMKPFWSPVVFPWCLGLFDHW